MELITKLKRIHRFFDSGRVEILDDKLIDEYSLRIILDGRDFMRVVIYPSQIEDYLIGFFMTRGIIKRPSDLESIETGEGFASVQRIPELRKSWPSLDLLETTGSRNVLLQEEKGLISSRDPEDFQTTVSIIRTGVKKLSDMPVFRQTGGTHCSILYTKEGEEVFSAEDIGRHNSVDKTIGGGLRMKADFSQCWMAVSGRLPSDMVIKPAIVGIPLIASISAPTSAGVDTAERTGLTLIGFSREGRFNCYSHPWRIARKDLKG